MAYSNLLREVEADSLVGPIKVKVHMNADGRSRSGRLFVDGAPEPSWPMPRPSLKGDDLANDAAWRRYNREEVRLMKEVAEAGLRALGDMGGLGPAGSLRYSRKAGCGCGCSPGFIIQGHWNQNIYVTLRDLDQEERDALVAAYGRMPG